MKKRLLKPPYNNGEIIFLPEPEGFFGRVSESHRIGVAHQPYFFHPGIAVKFLALEAAPRGKKEIVFLDTERVRIGAKIPGCVSPRPPGRDWRAPRDAARPWSGEAAPGVVEFITTDRLLYDYPAPSEDSFGEFLGRIEAALRKVSQGGFEKCLPNFLTFKEIIMAKTGRKLLREILAESFIEYYGLRMPCHFLSEILGGKEFRDLFSRIYVDQKRFRDVFNSALDEYREEFRFRYRNFPFPKLREEELPFWVVHEGVRARCFKKDVGASGAENLGILPRAAALTLFLRLYRFDFFIHGVGGWNYEWIQDRIIERFFKESPPPYAAASGTFLLDHLAEREFPYFLFSPGEISQRVREFMSHVP
jgi:hypothetical protein